MFDGQRTLDLAGPDLLDALQSSHLQPSPSLMDYLRDLLQNEEESRPSAALLLEVGVFLSCYTFI
jgi:hypothetical protein